MPTMESRRSLKDLFRRRPDVSLFLLGILCTALILPMSPLKMVSDSFRRMKSAAWIWSGRDPGGHLPGISGAGHHWDGVGQPLLMVPFDMAVASLGVADIETRFSIVARILFPAINGLVLMLSWHVLRQLGFGARNCSLGTLITLGCTTLMFHFQNNQENPLMLAYALVAVLGILRWNDSGSLLWLNLACAAQAGSVSIRVTNLAYVLPLFGLPLLTRIFDRSRSLDWRSEMRQLMQILMAAAPWALFAFALDRWWQWVRFGTLKGTYYTVFQQWAVSNFEGLPNGFPFSVRFWDGFSGLLLSPAKGVVFYEPLVVVGVVFWTLHGLEVTARTKALVFAGSVALLGTAVGLARLYYWDSEPNWGPRYLATPSHIVELPIAAWLATHLTRGSLGRRIVGLGALCVLLAVQVSGIWWPAYHENIELITRKGPEHARRSSEIWERGLPLQEPDGHTDWRFVNRPLRVAADIRLQLVLPSNQWADQKPPLRMIWITGSLRSLNGPTRWAVRITWLAGLAVALWLASQSVLGTETSRQSTPG